MAGAPASSRPAPGAEPAGNGAPTRERPPRRPASPSGPLVPAWLRASSEWTWRSLLIAFGVVALVYALGYLRVVVLPVIVALLATTLLLPPKRWLADRGLPDGAATALTMVGAVVLLAAVGTAVAPSIGGQVTELRSGVEDGVRQATRVLADDPFNVSRAELDQRVDDALANLRENSGSLTRGVTSAGVIIGELFTGLIVTALLTFFFLKDGTRMWSWIVGLIAGHHRREADELGARVFTALSGYVRGIALVGLVDAVLIGLALLVIGVPLVVPLMILTFLAAFMPLIGAFLAGLAAVLIALVSNGVVAALLVLGAIILVQQVEGHLLYPVLMSRTVHLHPAVIVLSLALGGVVAGIIGVFLAVPTAGVISTIIAYVRDPPQPGEPEAQAVPG
jgi:predicted PurR-regulated permease PerM